MRSNNILAPFQSVASLGILFAYGLIVSVAIGQEPKGEPLRSVQGLQSPQGKDSKKESAQAPVSPQSKAELIQAIERLAKQDTALIGRIEEEEPEQPAERNMFMVNPFVQNDFAKEFYGEAEILTTKNSEVVLISQSQLPGIKMYTDGEEKVCVQASVDKPWNASFLAPEIAKLFSWRELANAVRDSSEITYGSPDKKNEIQVVLDKTFFPSRSQENVLEEGGLRIQIAPAFSEPTVMDLTATFILSEKKELISLEYSVQYSHANGPQGWIAGGVAMVAGVPAMPLAAPVEANQVIVDVALPAVAPQVEVFQARPAVPLPANAIKPPKKEEGKDNDSKDNEGNEKTGPDANVALPAPVNQLLPGDVNVVQGVPNLVIQSLGEEEGGSQFGKVVTYAFRVQASPSKRAAAFIEEAKSLLRNRE